MNIEITTSLDAIVNALKQPGLFKFIDVKDFTIAATKIEPQFDYELPYNFPSCCNNHMMVKNFIENEIVNFCDAQNYNFEHYQYLIDIILYNYEYTRGFIMQYLKSQNTIEDIYDYINYNLQSFGTNNIASTIYIHLIKWNCDSFESKNKNLILKFIDSLYMPTDLPINSLDINMLCKTITNWVDHLPNLMHFEYIKQQYKSSINLSPLVKEIKYNKFSKLTKITLKSTEELIESLVNITENILKDITEYNSKDKYNTNEYKLTNIIIESHRIKQLKNLKKISSMPYIDIIEKWLETEKELWQEMNSIYAKNTINIMNSGNNNTINTGNNNILNTNYESRRIK